MNRDIIAYYRDRAREYDKVYEKPERKEEILAADAYFQEEFRGRNVIEIACGTGYWTERMAHTAASILATDINESVLEIARSRSYPRANVTFKLADIFELPLIEGRDALFAGFIWSHIKLHDLGRLITIVNSAVVPGGKVVFMDNNYVEGSSIPLSFTDEAGNTYQTRSLENGTKHLVLKNFPDNDFIRQLLNGRATNVSFINYEYYWILTYQTNLQT